MKYPKYLLFFTLFIAFSMHLFALEDSTPNLTPELSAVECDTQIFLNVCEQDILWAKNYGGSYNENLIDFDQTDDGGYILLGTSYSNDYDVTSSINTAGYWVVKTDSDGQILWANKYSEYSSLVSIKQISDGSYLVVYTLWDYPTLYNNVAKLDANGLVVWEKSYEYGSRNRMASFKETADGGFIFGANYTGDYTNFQGNLIESSGSYSNALLIKTDSQGNIEWDTNYNVNESVSISDLYQTADNGYLFTSNITYIGVVNTSDVLVAKYDENGVFQWEQKYGGSNTENLNASQQTSDGGFILAGQSNSSDGDVSANSGSTDFWIVKIDSQGNIEWDQNYPQTNHERIRSIQQTTDNGYIIAGGGSLITSSPSQGDFMLFKIDAVGSLEWKGYIGGSNYDTAIKILETADNEYVVGGYIYSADGDDIESNYGRADIWMAKFTTQCQETFNITGQLCNDNDTCTINDIYITDCDCQGTFIDADSDGICNNEDNCIYLNNDLIGTPCNDYNPCTQNDVYTEDCNCRGTLVDSDGDGVCDWYDNCPGFDNVSIGMPCDDGDVCTVNDTYDGNCICAGVPAEDYENLNEKWSHDYGIYGYNGYFNVMDKTEDGGFILAGFRNSGSFRVLKTDSLGNMEWEKRIGIDIYIPKSIIQTLDGGYVVVGEKFQYSNDDLIFTDFGNHDGFVVKLNADGEVEWAQGYGGSNDDEFISVLNAPDGGYYIGGQSTSNDLGLGDISRTDAWILKLDNTGNVEWQKLFGGHPYDYLLDLKHTLDGNLVFAGTRIRPNTTKGSYWLVKIDPQGATIWENEFGGAASDELFTMEVTSDGGYILGGWSNSTDGDISNPIGELDMWVVKADALGDLEWEHSYGTQKSNRLVDIKETPGGNFVIAGNVDTDETYASYGYGTAQLIIKIDALGNILFEDYTEEHNGQVEISGIQVTGEDEIVLLKYIHDFDTNSRRWQLSEVTLNTLDEIVGTPCDDGDPCTIEDVYIAFCECAGTWIGDDLDGDGICDGKDKCPDFNDGFIGDPCDDGDPCTLNDVISDDCLCYGLYTDSDDDGLCNTDDPCPFVHQDLIGMPCIDGDPCTKNEVYTADCECIGEEVFTDSDEDGVRNCEDICPNFDNNLFGTPCDDGFDFTCGDIYRYNCECSGYPCYYWEDYYVDDYAYNDDYDFTPTTGPQAAGADCMGIANGPNQLDACGVCDSDPSNNNQTCSDCAGVPNGTSQTDDCGNCLLPDDPSFNICMECKAYDVMEQVICDHVNGTYEILFILDQTTDNISFQITNNLTTEVTVTDEIFHTTESFTDGAGYSFTIAEVLTPECNITFERSALDCSTTKIELINFDGKAQENGNKLFWTTATEKSSSYFTLERSNNGTNFTAIDKIKSLGNSNIANTYQYLDKDVLKGNYYYRLLETNISGKTAIVSNVILLKREGQSEIVYTAPVPATEFVNVTFIMDHKNVVNYEVYDVTGKLIKAKVYEAVEGLNTLNINLQAYASGMYFIKIIDEKNTALVTRFVKED